MFWFVCAMTDRHNWKTHHRGHERAYWECGRFGCRATRKAPWYLSYQEFHGYSKPLHPID